MKQFLLLALLMACSSAFSAPAKSLKLSDRCDLNRENIGPGFKGHDAEQILVAIKKRTAVKDEFETQAEFAQREEDAIYTAVPAAQGGALCFVSDEKAIYDADAQEYWLPLLFNFGRLGLDPSPFSTVLELFVRERSANKGSYRGSNAFGVTAEVTQQASQRIVIGLDSSAAEKMIKQLKGSERDGWLSLPLAMDIEQAKSMRNRILLVVRYELVKPWFGELKNKFPPTFNNPVAETNIQSTVYAKIVQIAAFDRTTGDVLKTYDVPTLQLVH